jgi:hypothetical protein
MGAPPTWRPPYEPAYSHLLGLYLGDGWITCPGRTYQLRISLDALYPDLVDGCWASLALTTVGRHIHLRRHPSDRVVIVSSSWKGWPDAIPQHGPGRKHLRPIRLEPWQRRILDRHPQEFLRGLVESDGCRTINRFKVKLPSGRVGEYAYPRYFFSNLSEDIRGLFCEYCERIGVRWTQSNHRNISVSHRDSVAVLDSFIGPKR